MPRLRGIEHAAMVTGGTAGEAHVRTVLNRWQRRAQTARAGDVNTHEFGPRHMVRQPLYALYEGTARLRRKPR